VTSASYGQGLVNFFNGTTTKISTNSAVGGPATGPTSVSTESYYYGLFMAPNGTQTAGSFTFTGIYGTNTAATGRFSSDNGGQPSITGFAAGSTVNFLVKGWSANLGHDAITAQNYAANPGSIQGAFFGTSGIADGYLLGSAGSPPANLFGPATGLGGGQLGPFTLGQLPVVPEPSSLALVGLGAAAMLIFRRRKQ
jgi:hypothetical protein